MNRHRHAPRRPTAGPFGPLVLTGALCASCGGADGAAPGAPETAPSAERAPGGEEVARRPTLAASSAAGADPTPSDGEPPTATPPSDAEIAGSVTGPVGLSASVAMTQAGTLRERDLVAEVNRQRGPLQRCGPLVRRTDPMVGSLNLQLRVDASGRVTPDLQSPVNDRARACLLAAARGWIVRGAGSGEAMLLLVLDDAAGP